MLKHLTKINNLIAEQKFGEALIILDKSDISGNIEALKLKGLCYTNLNKYQDALEIFKQIIEISDEDATVWYYLASIYDNLDDAENAEKAYLKVISLRDKYINAYKNLALLYVKQSNWEKAIEYAQRACDIDGEDYQPYYIIGTVNFAQKNYEASLPFFEKAIEKNSEHVQLYNNMGSAYLALNNLLMAKNCFEKALEIDKNNALANYNLANFYQIKRDYETAFKYFQVAYSNDPSPNFLASLAYCALKAEKYDMACSLYATLVVLFPEKQNFKYNLVCAHEANGNYKDAAKLLKELLILNPKSISMSEKLADIYLKLDEPTEAKLIYEKLISKGSVSPSVYHNYALICMQLNDMDKAQLILKKLILLDAKNAYAHKDLGIIYLSQRLFDYAKDEFDEALKSDGENPLILFEYANYLHAVADYRTADIFYKKALSLSPDDAKYLFFAGLNASRLNNLEEAKEFLEKSLKLDANSDVIYHLAQVYAYLEEYNKALELLDCEKVNEQDFQIKYLFAFIYYKKQDFTSAINKLSELLREYNENLNIILLLAQSYLGAKRFSDAQKAAETILNYFPDHSEALEIIKKVKNK